MKRISRLIEISKHHAAVICDLWGVIHDGRRLFHDAVGTLRSLRAAGQAVVILSNSPRPHSASLSYLRALGAPVDWFDACVTSGDLTRAHLLSQPSSLKVYHLGQRQDGDTLEGLPHPRARTPEDADLVICTGFADHLGLSLEAHVNFLRAALASRRPMICANPDKSVPIGGGRVHCAGIIAERYQQEGGPVLWLGKPEPVAYEACSAKIALTLGRQVSYAEILAIGDNLETDIAGALRLGMTSVLIREGLHGHFTNDELEATMKSVGVRPDYEMAQLKG